MNPAFSVIFVTTLIGSGQGLFIALVLANSSTGLAGSTSLTSHDSTVTVIGCLISLCLLIGGLFASFFHLGHPERAWRAAACWRTSWLSREVILLPLLMGCIAVYLLIYLDGELVEWLPGAMRTEMFARMMGWFGVVLAFALFICTAMIYACIRFIEEWSSPLTLVNFILLGLSSGFILANALMAYFDASVDYRVVALALTVATMMMRLMSLARNRRLKSKSTLQTAIGIKHRHITQRSQGAMGGSFNTRDFFHHCSELMIRNVVRATIALAFVVPILILIIAALLPVVSSKLWWLFGLAFGIQFIGLLAERWLFFAQANHPQNLYYQTIS